MARVEIHEENLDEVVGGALVWDNGVVYPLGNPDLIASTASQITMTAEITSRITGPAVRRTRMLWRHLKQPASFIRSDQKVFNRKGRRTKAFALLYLRRLAPFGV